MLKNYKLSFEIWGLLLFLIVMIPNFIWFAIPAPNDILRAESITEMVDTAASVCQILMIVSICIFRNRESKKLCISPFVIMVTVYIALIPISMLMYGKEASNRKQEIDRRHHTIPNQRNQRPKDKHYGNVHNWLWNHG